MAKIMIVGDVAQVELVTEYDEDGESFVIAACVKHGMMVIQYPDGCGWTGQYATFTDACSSPHPEMHADIGRG